MDTLTKFLKTPVSWNNLISKKNLRIHRRKKILPSFPFSKFYDRLNSFSINFMIQGAFNKFPDFFVQALFKCLYNFLNHRRFLKIQYVIAIHLMGWMTNLCVFRFKRTATAAIGIHPWLSLLVNFKNAIWTWGHIRRTICNKILF